MKLFIIPHVDDEVLGCGGILDSDSFVYFCGLDESLVAPDPAHRIPMKDREVELRKVANFLGFSYHIDYASKVNHFKVTDHIGNIEGIINKLKPDIVFIPHPGYNQDHQTIFKACQVALRPHDKNHFVRKVLIFEAIHDFIWSHNAFQPNFFIPIDIEKKVKAYSFYESQVRSYRSPEMLRQLAQIRGKMCNSDAAEAFKVIRWVAHTVE